jgi:3D-(3,5/4)-trihydroxycyclohexane-1,2-dione acylhydrolase (decyclizing)
MSTEPMLQLQLNLDEPAGRLAAAIGEAGGLEAALTAGLLSRPVRISLAEAIVLGLMRQGVSKYFAIFGHGSTAIAETLRIYESHGLVRTWQFRNEVEMAHAATALRWAYGECCAVVTSIGPGALQAMAGSLAAASNGIGVYHIYGDETTHGEGYNMQQIPKPEQGLYGRITALMGRSYVLHTPEALREALRRGAATVFHPYKAAPFYLLAPINTQPREVEVRIDALPRRPDLAATAPSGDGPIQAAAKLISSYPEIVIKAGGGTRRFPAELRRFAEAAGAAVVLSPGTTGVLPDAHPQNMHVGGTKGSISGNAAMQNARLLVVVGSRAVCQSDCSGIGYPKVEQVININADVEDVQHYNGTLPLVGDIGAILARLTDCIQPMQLRDEPARRAWLEQCAGKKDEWTAFKADRYRVTPPADAVWAGPVFTQPQAIKIVADFCKSIGALKLFDAGDVQSNGLQIVEDDTPTETITEAGASYMGFAVSALLAAAAAKTPRYTVAFTGDGSFMMNPQVLIDAMEHGVHATIVLFDNRRMGAITSLQHAQYGREYRTNDSVAVDYVRLASSVEGVLALDGGVAAQQLEAALARAAAHKGLSLVHVRVYHGTDPQGGMGAYGRWNVGNWVGEVEDAYRKTRI